MQTQKTKHASNINDWIGMITDHEEGTKPLSRKETKEIAKFAAMSIKRINVSHEGIYVDLADNAIVCACDLDSLTLSGINMDVKSVFLKRA